MIEVEEDLLTDMIEGIFEISKRLEIPFFWTSMPEHLNLKSSKEGVRTAKAPTGTLSGNLFGDTSASSGRAGSVWG